MPSKSKGNDLLQDPDIRRWHDNLAARSVITAGVYLRTLGLYCRLADTTPKEILAEAQSRSFRDEFIDFIRRLESEKKANSSTIVLCLSRDSQLDGSHNSHE